MLGQDTKTKINKQTKTKRLDLLNCEPRSCHYMMQHFRHQPLTAILSDTHQRITRWFLRVTPTPCGDKSHCSNCTI